MEADHSVSTQRKPQNVITTLILVMLIFALFISIAGFSLLTPFFPQIATRKGVTDTELGLIFASFQLSMFIMSPVYGSLIVRIKPKFMCVSGAFLCGGCCLLFAFISYADGAVFKTLCFIIRIVEGNGSAMLVISSTSLIMRTFPGSTSKMSSLIEVAVGCGYLFGPLVGSLLYQLDGYYLPFVVVGSCTTGLSVLMLFLLPDVVEEEEQTENFLSLLKIPGILIIFFICLSSTFSLTYTDPTFSEWACNSFHITPYIVGFILSGEAATYALVSPITGFFADKGFVYTPMLIGLFGTCISFLIMAPSPLISFLIPKPIFGLTIFSNILLGCMATGIFVPTYQAGLDLAVLNGYQPSLHTFGMLSGMANSGGSLGALLGPTVSGIMNDKFGFPWAVTFMAFTLVLMGVVLIAFLSAMKIMERPLKPDVDVCSVTEDENQPLLQEQTKPKLINYSCEVDENGAHFDRSAAASS